ncbi:MAG: NusG domain II-containing protein [Lachnospiraceae bacterium]|nr:NusG domain II-containing protein [Lachnospiraceae bacterium]
MAEKSSRKNDLIFIGVLVFAGVVLAVCYGSFRARYAGQGTVAEVRVAGGVGQQFALEENVDVEISGVNGGVNHLHIENGQVWVTEASCPDQICVHMGRISQPGQSIICLPNQVVIEILGREP